LNLNDVSAFVELNFGDFYDPNSEIADSSPLLQAFLDYAGAYALAITDTTLDDQNLRGYVRATLPRGNYFIANQIVVPEWVDFHMLGTLCRNPGGSLNANLFLPLIVYTANSCASRVNVYLNDGSHTGSGVCFGKSWTIASVTLATAGSGYQVGDIIYLPQISKAPYYPASITVNSVSAGGAIATFSLTSGGQ
jgi:hypothetical protein